MLETIFSIYLSSEEYLLSTSIYERCLSLTNLIAFISYFIQILGLIGSDGISPAIHVLNKYKKSKLSYQDAKTIYLLPILNEYFPLNDFTLQFHCLLGILCSLLAFLGIFTGINIFLCSILYLSLISIGSWTMGLQMHSTLIETDFIYVIFSPFITSNQSIPLVLVNFSLIYRVMLGGGLGKLTGSDKSWIDLKSSNNAMTYHHWTTVLPGYLGSFMHCLPLNFHRFEILATFISEILGAILMLIPLQICRTIAFLLFSGLMFFINLDSNYAHLGFMTITQSLNLISDSGWIYLFNETCTFLPFISYIKNFLYWAIQSPFSLTKLLYLDSIFQLPILNEIPYILAILYILTGLIPLRSTLHGEISSYLPNKLGSLYDSFATSKYFNSLYLQFHYIYRQSREWCLFGRYVKFAHMTKTRWEIVIEGSNDKINWLEYDFRYKPSDINRTPPIIFGHMPSLDWRCWFISLDVIRGTEPPAWFYQFLMRLLEGSSNVLNLLGHNPFPHKPPLYLRALLYDYRWTKEVINKSKLFHISLDTNTDPDGKDISTIEKDSDQSADISNMNNKADRNSSDIEWIRALTGLQSAKDKDKRIGEYWTRIRFCGQLGPIVSFNAKTNNQQKEEND